jgi:hypothetical protein
MHRKLALPLFVLITVTALLLSAASPHSAAEQAAKTQAARLASTATSVKATAQAGTTKIAATATALKATAQVGATKLAGTATSLSATATAIRATRTPWATVTSEEAKAAIESYATNVLGIAVTVRKAGGLTNDVTKTLTQTPNGSSAQSATVKLAVKTYYATLANGAASLSYGKGTISGDVNVDVQASSLGVYSLMATNTGTLTASTALALAKATFPNLAHLKYTSYTVSKGYAWYAKGTVSALDPKTKKIVTLAQSAILYVLPNANNKANVSATVGRGEFASAIKAP